MQQKKVGQNRYLLPDNFKREIMCLPVFQGGSFGTALYWAENHAI